MLSGTIRPGHEKAISYVRGNGVTSVMPFSVVWFFRGRQSARAWKQGEPDRFVPQLGQVLKDGFFQNSEKGPLIPAIFMGVSRRTRRKQHDARKIFLFW